jgi:hypothetical protein
MRASTTALKLIGKLETGAGRLSNVVRFSAMHTIDRFDARRIHPIFVGFRPDCTMGMSRAMSRLRGLEPDPVIASNADAN